LNAIDHTLRNGDEIQAAQLARPTISVTFWKSLDLRKRDQIDRARDTATPTPRMQVTKKNVKTAPGAG